MQTAIPVEFVNFTDIDEAGTFTVNMLNSAPEWEQCIHKFSTAREAVQFINTELDMYEEAVVVKLV